jgi:hypothetical protein
MKVGNSVDSAVCPRPRNPSVVSGSQFIFCDVEALSNADNDDRGESQIVWGIERCTDLIVTTSDNEDVRESWL